ncbi:hypothetical protein [Nocardioides speluncae]|uniref:hypothetical protein n=1 Tax=Nocardioides speluncae TaxID=2670337 RepID=UPI0012B165E8|nr:hypothetical protein [Nocardioides speluncae]
MELLPTITPWIVGFFVIAGLGAALAIGVIAEFVTRNHRIRVRRQESIPTYYGRLVHSH